MTIAQQLGRVNAKLESATSLNECFAMFKLLALAKGNASDARLFAEQDRYSPRVIEALREKSAAGIGTMADATNAAPLALYNQLINAALGSLRNVGVFDRVRPDMIDVTGLRSRAIVVTTGATGSAVSPGQSKLISKLTLSGSQTDEIKTACIVIATEELLRLGGAVASGLFGRELLAAVALQTDAAFVSALTAGVSSASATGATAYAIRADLSNALDSMSIGSDAKLYILVETKTAKNWATKVDNAGNAAFPEMTPTGGIVCGMPTLVCDGLSANTVVVFDASQIVSAAGTIELDSARDATIQFETAPDSPVSAATVTESLFQAGKVALRAERYFTALPMRTTAAAIINSVSYSGDSPN
jgi:hypothetical protein